MVGEPDQAPLQDAGGLHDGFGPGGTPARRDGSGPPARRASALGSLLETFVLTELLKLRTVSQVPVGIWQLREGEDREIGFVLEGPGGTVVGIEVKATTSPGADTARHLRWFKEKVGDRFQGGIVFHLGSRSSSFGDAIQAVPVSALWGHAAL